MNKTTLDTLDLEGWELSDNQVPDKKYLRFKVKNPEKLFQKFLKKSKGEVFYVAEHEDLTHVFIPTNVKLDEDVNLNVISHEYLHGVFWFVSYGEAVARLILQHFSPDENLDVQAFLRNLLKIADGTEVIDELNHELWITRKAQPSRSELISMFKTKKALKDEFNFNYVQGAFNGAPMLEHYKKIKLIEINEDYALCIHKEQIKKFKLEKIHLVDWSVAPDYFNITMRNMAGGIYLCVKTRYSIPREIKKFLKNGMDPYIPRVNTKKESNAIVGSPAITPQTKDHNPVFPAQGSFSMEGEQTLSVGQEIVLSSANGQSFTMTVTAMPPASAVMEGE